MTATIGHNSGRVVEPGHSWRKHVWTKARKELLPTLPLEVVRIRVKRAAQLGLPYKTYAGIRASTGHDLVGFLFSSNALQIIRDGQPLPSDRMDKLHSLIKTKKIGIAHAAISPTHIRSLSVIDAAYAAPQFAQSWSVMRDHMAAIIRDTRQPADRFVMIGDTAFERDWSEAAAMAGYLTAPQYFAP